MLIISGLGNEVSENLRKGSFKYGPKINGLGFSQLVEDEDYQNLVVVEVLHYLRLAASLPLRLVTDPAF